MPARLGYLLQGLPVVVEADERFFCAMSGRLMTEPVRHSSGVVCDRVSLNDWFTAGLRNICPVTGRALDGWVSVTAYDGLRAEIETWASLQQLDFDALTAAKYKAPAGACRCGLVPPACACSSPVESLHVLEPLRNDWAQYCASGKSQAVRSGSGSLAPEACSHAEVRARGLRRSFSLPSIETA
ncbi:hypothetical protein WJX81_006010 [Elliptochloris bilobata]|uniref:U-box domain-containing protein n=1 Tax=Elliptochloris bilobata TaxID=381761 RepID=A0AAW1RMU2_9CHLO